MNQIKNIIRNYKKNIEEITLDTYSNRINTLSKKGINFYDYSGTISRIGSLYSIKTQKACITAIVVYLKAINADSNLIDNYSAKLLHLGEEINTKEKDNVLKEGQKLITRKEITDIIEGLKTKLNTSTIDSNYMDLFQQYLVINLYHLILPLRNDFVNTEVYTDALPFFIDNQKNYIILDKKQLILNRYKTKNKYGQAIIDLPIDLVNIIKRWIDVRTLVNSSLANQRQLLLNKKLVPMTQVNLTQFLNKIFKRKVSSDLLRKSWISEKYPVIHTVNDMERDAKNMKHSVTMQQSTYRKKS